MPSILKDKKLIKKPYRQIFFQGQKRRALEPLSPSRFLSRSSFSVILNHRSHAQAE